MNCWTSLSIEYANQRSYLDDLFKVYPTIPNGIRDLDESIWESIENSYKQKNNIELINKLLSVDLFPIKDSYVAYLKRDRTAIERNPETINRLCGRLYEMGLEEMYRRCSEPKETNRQIGPLFRRWLDNKSLGLEPISSEEFLSNKSNAILGGSDAGKAKFAKKYLNYSREKGLDFVGRFNDKYIIGEAKFLTDFGGHQNAQFEDAITTVKLKKLKAVPIAILDGVLYIDGKNKMYRQVKELSKYNILSSLVLRDFLYQI